MSTNAKFDPAPPSPYSGNWEEAARADDEGTPRFTTYQAPGGKPIPFVLESFDFSSGQSVDTAEYPFHGYWSNESLNEKTQQLTIEGFVRGAHYIAKRNALVQALRIKTADNNPGFIDFPFWGRFAVVVSDYKIGERSDEQGQCSVSLTFTRAGVTLEERLAAVIDTGGLFDLAKEELVAAVIEDFDKKLRSAGSGAVVEIAVDNRTLAAALLALKSGLLDIVGRVQAGQQQLSVLSSEVSSYTNLINQGIFGAEKVGAGVCLSGSCDCGQCDQHRGNVSGNVFRRELDRRSQCKRKRRDVFCVFYAGWKQ